MKRNLVVTYPDGREDVYPVAAGQSMLGSSPECAIGIQAKEVEARHVVFWSKGKGVFVVNLCEPETVLLNDVPLERRSLLNVGDTLKIGNIRVHLRLDAEAGEDLSATPAGVAEVIDSVRREVPFGWRGYRKMLEKTAPFISPDEAAAAERQHRAGQRAFRWSLAIVLSLAVLAWFFAGRQWFELKQALYCIDLHAVLFIILALTARYRVRTAGRLLLALQALLFWSPPRTAWMEHIHFMRYGTLIFVICLFCLGWLIDIGAGCVFAGRRRGKAWRYLLLVLGTAVLGGLTVLPYYVRPTPPPGSPLWFFPLPLLALTYPLWWRKLGCAGGDERFDVAFVAEQASYRSERRLRARISTVLLVSTPLIIALASLGSRERISWDETRNDGELVVTVEESGEKTAWYRTSRGRYLEKSDFDDGEAPIYQLPFGVLLAGGGETGISAPDGGDIAAGMPARRAARMAKRLEKTVQTVLDAGEGAALGGTGLEICRRIAAVQADATNTLYYASLKETLAPYRIGPEDTERFAAELAGDGTALVVFLEEVDNRENYNSGPNPKLHSVLTYRRGERGGELQGHTAAEARAESLVIGAKVIPSLVLVALASLFLWKRGGDSHLGFWLGVALSFSALFLHLSPVYRFTDEPMMEYQLWRWALQHSVGSLFSAWFALLTVVATRALYFVFISCAPPALFVLLCWPEPPARRREGWWRRTFVCLGKFLAGFGVMALAGAGSYWISGKSMLLSRVIAMIVVGALGAWLRRTRRFDTEAPELGWGFFAAWFLLDLSVALPKLASTGLDPLVPASWLAPLPWLGGGVCLVGLVAGATALAGGILFLNLCLKKDFLSVMTANGFTLALFAFSVPIFAEICESLTEEALHGSFLQSEQGERILSVAVIVLILSPLWKSLNRLSRRISLRNLARVETDVEKTLEDVLDDPNGGDVRDAIFARLGELGLKRYAFYARGKSGMFNLILKNGWTGPVTDSFHASSCLRRFLGTHPHAIDLERLEHDEDLFFQSFELWQIGQRLHGAYLLPICLGKSVRAILVTPADAGGGAIPDSEVFRENVNALGLATIASMGGSGSTEDA